MSASRRSFVIAGTSLMAGCATSVPQPAPGPAPGPPPAVQAGDGVRIAYGLQGRGETTVVLVHGWCCDRSYWREQVPALAARHRVLAIDLPGHGASGNNRRDWSVARFGADVAAVLAAVGAKNVVLVGHSLGGAVVAEASRRLPSGVRLSALVGVDTWRGIGTPPIPEASRRALVAAFTRDFAGTMRRTVTATMFRPDAPRALVDRIANDMAGTEPKVGLAMPGGLFETSWESALARSKVPVVAINSGLGGITDEARARPVVPGFRVVTLAGTGHFLMLEAPARFNAALLAQIDAVAA